VPVAAKLLIVLLASPLVIVAVHGVTVRYFLMVGREAPNQLVCGACIFLGYLPVGLLAWYFAVGPLYKAGAEWLVPAVYGVVVYTLIGYIYFHFFNMTETARRIRIMTELHRRGPMKTAEIVRAYDDGDITDVRIERLLSMGQIEESGGRYLLKGRFLYIVALALHYWGSAIGFPLRGRKAS
jgi:hypothetical protein